MVDHHDEIVRRAGVEKGRSRLVGSVGSEFLLVAEGDDRDRLGTGHLAPESLLKETADHFEMLYQVAPAVFAGGGKELEVGRLNAQPRIARRGQGGGSQGDEQKASASESATRGSRADGCVRPTCTHHDEECITGSAEPSSMRATSACSRSVRSMRPASFRPRVSMGRPMRTVTRPLRM